MIDLNNVLCFHMQEKFEEMQEKICSTVETQKVPEETRRRHKGFNEWKTKVNPRDHPSIVEVGSFALDPVYFHELKLRGFSCLDQTGNPDSYTRG